MERLAGIDASFLYVETPTVHMHTIKVVVIDPAEGTPSSFERVKAAIRDRLHLLPPFRRRVIEVPFGLHHPVWVNAIDVDLDHHVRRAEVPAPGGSREIDALVSMIASVPLDRGRPLWELWVLEGLPGGRIVIVAKIHHAVADGVAVAGLLANVLTPADDTLAASARAAAWRPEPLPSRGRLLRDAMRDHLRQVRHLPGLTRESIRNLLAVARSRRKAAVRPPRPLLDAPSTSLNGALSSRRSFASTALALADVRRVRTAFGVTFNDVLLALVAATLRTHLSARGELPTRPLLAEVPVATDRAGMTPRLAGNRLSNIFASLATDVVDPVARLRAIHDSMQAAKVQHELLGPELYREWSEYAPPRLVAWWMRQYSRLRMADRHRPPVNVIVSCVSGPRESLDWPEGRLAAIYSVGPIIEGAALNVTAWSYLGHLYVGVLSCPDLLPDPHVITDGLHEALAELCMALQNVAA